MNDDRAGVFERLRRAAPAGRPTPALRPGASWHRSSSLELFRREAEAAGATVQGPLAPDDARDLVSSMVLAERTRSVLAWAPTELPVPRLHEELARVGVEVLLPDVPGAPVERHAVYRRFEAAPFGITGAVGALADTGTVVLESGPGRSRLAWLLPPAHIVLLPIASVRADLPTFLAERSKGPGLGAHLAFVTGPSRTADIELTLTRGVHGPGEVRIILVA